MMQMDQGSVGRRSVLAVLMVAVLASSTGMAVQKGFQERTAIESAGTAIVETATRTRSGSGATCPIPIFRRPSAFRT